jgi:hypothetical protein
VNSDGKVVENSIKNNLRAGILTASKTTTLIDANVIEDNLVSGVVIKDPSKPILRRN